jgi:alpha-glucosidase
MRRAGLALVPILAAAAVSANYTDPNVLDACPGYKATGIVSKGSTLTANLALAGKACSVYGPDIKSLKLEVTYETR